ncbi:MAG: cytidine deaminase [Patescibacteria group bacterium]|nr:MAG: cytidine deaminase [Patescibacteria group bacterium]
MPPTLRSVDDSSFAEMVEPLLTAARDARRYAHAPYSKFQVGAALLVRGHIFTGVNIETVDYLVTHAEGSAISAMRAAGYGEMQMIVAVGAMHASPPDQAPVVTPCGKCRQDIYEWVMGTRHDIDVIVPDPVSKELRLCSIRELLPLSFGG